MATFETFWFYFFVVITDLAAKALTTITMAIMDQGTTSRGLAGDLVDQTGLAPIIAGPLGGPQEALIGEALVHQAPGLPQVSTYNCVCMLWFNFTLGSFLFSFVLYSLSYIAMHQKKRKM